MKGKFTYPDLLFCSVAILTIAILIAGRFGWHPDIFGEIVGAIRAAINNPR